MKRFLSLAAAVVFALPAAAQNTTLTFNDLADSPFLNLSYNGYAFTGSGNVYQQALYGNGDGYPIYMTSNTPFNLVSADFKGLRQAFDGIIVRGYSADFVDAYNANPLHTDPYPIGRYQGSIPTPTYYASFDVGSDVFQTAVFNWTGLKAVFFDASGGPEAPPACCSYAENYLVDNITVNTAPEPSTLVLLASGVLLLIGVRRKSSRLAA